MERSAERDPRPLARPDWGIHSPAAYSKFVSRKRFDRTQFPIARGFQADRIWGLLLLIAQRSVSYLPTVLRWAKLAHCAEDSRKMLRGLKSAAHSYVDYAQFRP